MDEPDYPIALLIGLDKSERVIRVTEPPPPDYRIPIQQRVSVKQEEPSQRMPDLYRTFRLGGYRSRSHRWMRVYNEGRSRTPEPAYVYLERRPVSLSPEEPHA